MDTAHLMTLALLWASVLTPGEVVVLVLQVRLLVGPTSFSSYRSGASRSSEHDNDPDN